MPDKNTVFQLASVLFKDANIAQVQKIMMNPMRGAIQLQLAALESFMTSFLASEADPNKMPAAFMSFIVERLEDPLRLFAVLLNAGQAEAG